MARVNIFLADDLLKAIDAEAAKADIGRSALVQSALTRYLESIASEREQVNVRRGMEAAARRMDALAERFGSWDATKVIREFRDTRGVAVQEPKVSYRAPKKKRRT